MAAATATEGHIRKRQFQPSITSYFGHAPDGRRASSARSPLSPPLPPETQASLLSVGMRVRKSVPEGYKTHKTMGVDAAFPFPSTAPATTTTTRTYQREASRELMPFCGLHKTGGLASQPAYVPASSAHATVGRDEDEDEDEEAMPGMTGSQATLPSTQGSFGSMGARIRGLDSKKRGFEDEIEEDMDAFFDEVDASNEDAMMSTAAAVRRIAKPKAPLRKAVTDGVVLQGGVVGVAGDFDDALFLAPMDVDAA